MVSTWSIDKKFVANKIFLFIIIIIIINITINFYYYRYYSCGFSLFTNLVYNKYHVNCKQTLIKEIEFFFRGIQKIFRKDISKNGKINK